MTTNALVSATSNIQPLTYHSESEYAEFIASISTEFNNHPNSLLYRSNCDDLLSIYAKHTDQTLNCNCCKRFINNVGSALIIHDDGSVESAFWNPENVPDIFKPMVAEMKAAVEQCMPVQPFTLKVYKGVQSAGGFKHLFAEARVLTRLIASSDFTDKYNYLGSFFAYLSQMSVQASTRAAALLTTGKMHREKETLAWLTFLMEGQKLLQIKNHKERKAKILKHIEGVAHGWLKPKGSTVGYLLANITEGRSDSVVIAAHNKITKPEAYARPTVAPSDGTVKVAMALFDEMGLYDSLPHRFIRLDELENVCGTVFIKPEEPIVEPNNPFAPMLSTEPNTKPIVLDVAPIEISITRFMVEIVPNISKLEVFGQQTVQIGSFARAIKDLDSEKQLTKDKFIRFYWTNEFTSLLSDGLHVVQPLEVNGHWVNCIGVSDKNFIIVGKPTKEYHVPLFPNDVNSKLWPVRSVIERYAKTNVLQPTDTGESYFMVSPYGHVRVTKDNVVTKYKIFPDR